MDLFLLDTVKKQAGKTPNDPAVYEDWVAALRLLWAEKSGWKEVYPYVLEFRQEAGQAMQKQRSARDISKIYEQIRRSYLLTAPEVLSDFMYYIEWNQLAEKRFYQPRMSYLTPMVTGYQKILDGELDLLTVSQPKRTGKTMVEMRVLAMVSGKEPNKSSIISGAGDDLVDSFYRGMLSMYQDNESLMFDVFPEATLVKTNADKKTINLKENSWYPTMTFKTVGGTFVGSTEATNLLIIDDPVKGREDARNLLTMDSLWEVISGDIFGRNPYDAPVIVTGTRYTEHDPVGRAQQAAKEMGLRWDAIEIPALDPVTGESNYEFIREGKKEFTTEHFLRQKSLVSEEQWDSEFQQTPIDRKGRLFPEEKLNRYLKLPPDKEPDTIVATCDTKEKGIDYVMLPVGYVYGEDVFIVDCVYNNGPPDITKPKCAKILTEHHVASCTFESNNAGEYYARDVDELEKSLGGKTAILTKRSIANKLTRIVTSSDNIIKHFWFKDKSLYAVGSEYDMMIKALTSYTGLDKNQHDDAPDGLAMLENKLRMAVMPEVQIIKRIW